MATHSSILAWSMPWTEEPGRLQSMGLQSWTRLNDLARTFGPEEGLSSTPWLSWGAQKCSRRECPSTQADGEERGLMVQNVSS